MLYNLAGDQFPSKATATKKTLKELVLFVAFLWFTKPDTQSPVGVMVPQCSGNRSASDSLNSALLTSFLCIFCWRVPHHCTHFQLTAVVSFFCLLYPVKPSVTSINGSLLGDIWMRPQTQTWVNTIHRAIWWYTVRTLRALRTSANKLISPSTYWFTFCYFAPRLFLF